MYYIHSCLWLFFVCTTIFGNLVPDVIVVYSVSKCDYFDAAIGAVATAGGGAAVPMAFLA